MNKKKVKEKKKKPEIQEDIISDKNNALKVNKYESYFSKESETKKKQI